MNVIYEYRRKMRHAIHEKERARIKRMEKLQIENEREARLNSFIKRHAMKSTTAKSMLVMWYERHHGIEPTHYYDYEFPVDRFRIMVSSAEEPLPPGFGSYSVGLIVPDGIKLPMQKEFTHNDVFYIGDGQIPDFRPWYVDM